MTRMIVRSKTGADGVLHLNLPLGPSEASREVQVTVESVPAIVKQDEWERRVLATAGSIPDPSFRRYEQGE